MIGVAFVLAGWLIGRVIYGYVHHFAFRLSQEIHAAYVEIYPENPPHFAPEKSILTPIQTKISQPYYCLFFAVFSLIYYGAKGYYKQEAFGRGDCWLALGLGTFFSYDQLPAFLLFACLSGLVYALYSKLNKRHVTAIPFGPFLSLSGVLCRLLN